MSDDEGIDTPDEIAGIGDARAVLGIDRDADDDVIDAAFERLADDADGDRYWTAVAAREVARLGSVRNGLVIADVLRRQPTPADLTSLADAASLLSYSPPPSESRQRTSYNRGLSRTLETITERLATLAAGSEFDVPEGTVRAVEVASHALRERDLTAGKRWVLGPEAGTETTASGGSAAEPDPMPDRDTLIHGWAYSVTSDGSIEYYAAPNGDTLIRLTTATAPGGPETGCEATRIRDGDDWETRTGRYGELKRLVKRWIIDHDATDRPR
ncbi:hypothetical protein [Natrinema pallidum]|uniref:Uncharacterized protein n=1 Tax=Natrinema pallidum DSM 3751 TaxID=1227495 RepID=L9YG23_9EURY|nr:hypothetical protein [Natrinema pallidum]ELY72676.1 hypothetical protein C487_18471 [Natrinema pallidum DSM 3751]